MKKELIIKATQLQPLYSKTIDSKKALANYNSPSVLPIFTISIAFPMQMGFSLPKFFHQASYCPYSPNVFTAKVFKPGQRLDVCMCVCVRVRTYVSACPPPRLLITSGVIWTSYDWLNKFYSCYMATVVVIVNGRGLGIGTRRRHKPHKSQLAQYKVCNSL